MDTLTQYALAYALTTSAGLRALVPLAALSVAAHFGFFHPPSMFAWLGGTGVSVALVGVALLDLLADKIPFVDHALHVVHIVVKPAAAAILVGGLVHTPSHSAVVGLMILGALNALGVHAAVAGMRGFSTATTGGIANPVASLSEDIGSLMLVLAAWLAPILAAALALAATVAAVALARTLLRRRTAPG